MSASGLLDEGEEAPVAVEVMRREAPVGERDASALPVRRAE